MSAKTRLNHTTIHRAGRAFNSLLLIALVLGCAPSRAGANELSAQQIGHQSLAVSPPSEGAGDEAPAAERAPTTLTPGMQKALDYVKNRYKVSKEAIHPLFEAIQGIGIERGIDPLLIVAIIGIESGFKPGVKSGTGGHGLMQIIPRFHLDKIPDGLGAKGLMDPIVNVKVGTRILDDAIRRTGSPIAGLQSYNGSDKKQLFANRVLAEKARLEKTAP
jgi:soluble lytic murein transglycosylase-like protein